MKNRRILILICILTGCLMFVVGLSTKSIGQEVKKVGTSSAAFLRIPVGTKAIAMGSAFTAVADDGSAMFWNPGNIAPQTDRTLFIHHSPWLPGLDFQYIGISLPLSHIGVVGINVVSLTSAEMDVTTPEQAKIAEDAGAVSVMALERIPADIRAAGGVARMTDPEIILKIMDSVSIPVMAKARIGHFGEARILEAIGIDYIDESEVLTPADEKYHIDKWKFKVPFVCGAVNLGEALRRIGEGAAMVRTKGEAGTGDVVEAVRHMRNIRDEIARIALKLDAGGNKRGDIRR